MRSGRPAGLLGSFCSWPYNKKTAEFVETKRHFNFRNVIMTPAFSLHRFVFAISIAACASVPAAAQCPDAAALTRDVAEPLATVRYLADDALQGRLAGTAGERCAGDYIAA